MKGGNIPTNLHGVHAVHAAAEVVWHVYPEVVIYISRGLFIRLEEVTKQSIDWLCSLHDTDTRVYVSWVVRPEGMLVTNQCEMLVDLSPSLSLLLMTSRQRRVDTPRPL